MGPAFLVTYRAYITCLDLVVLQQLRPGIVIIHSMFGFIPRSIFLQDSSLGMRL